MGRKFSDFLYKKMIKGLARVLARDGVPMPKSDTPITADETADLNLIAFGDPQISALSPLRSARVYSAVQDIKNATGHFDALLMLGDITEYGAWCEYRMTARLLEAVEDRFSKMLILTGNHDIRIRSYKKQLRRFNDFIALLKNGIPHGTEHYYYSTEIGGYRFIALGADRNAFEASWLSEEQLAWLDKELDKCNDGKPVFVLNHQTLKYANGLPASWLGKGKWRGSVGRQSEQLRAIFEKHGNIIFITGHLHYGISAFSYEDYGSYKCLALPTVGVLNHGANDALGQGYVITVKGNTVTARGRCFCEGRYYGAETENAVIEINC